MVYNESYYPIPYIIIHPDGRLPVIPNTLGSAHHRGHYAYGFNHLIDPNFIRQNASDEGTGSTIPKNFETIIKGRYGRFLGDLNRGPDNENRFVKEWSFMGKARDIFIGGTELSADQKNILHTHAWQPYHDQILRTMIGFENYGLIVAWDNTENGPKPLGTDKEGNPVRMHRKVIISNKGSAGSGYNLDSKNKILTPDEETTCDPAFMAVLQYELLKALRRHGFLVDEVLINEVYKGGYITEHYNTRRHPELKNLVQADVESVQIEYDLGFTHDLMPDGIHFKPDYNKIRRFRRAAEEAMHHAAAGLKVA